MLSRAPAPAQALLGAAAIWLRNATVWRRTWRTSLVGSIGEPLFYVLGLGFGLSTIIPDVDGVPYLRFVAPGLMLSSVMQSVTIEATYMIYTKMEHQKVYASVVLAPLTFGDILLGEILWIVTKGLISGGTVLALLLAFGIGPVWPGLLGIPLILVAGVVFASLGLVVTSFARGYDFFNYYFTLFVAPMFFFSGIFFPTARLGPGVEAVGLLFPLTHLVTISRAIFAGPGAPFPAVELAVVGALAVGSFLAAAALLRRRFMP